MNTAYRPVRTFCVVIGLLTLAATATAQVARGSINGTVKDESGAVLPGVSIVVTSPALQVPQLETVSAGDGTYVVLDLPVGTYKATYQLSGFATVIREQIQLASGFAARIDAVMKVGALEETVTVSGQSPIVDVTSTRGGGTVSAELIQTMPVNMTSQDILLMAPGAHVPGPPQVAAVGFRLTGSPVTYGLPGQANYRFDGIETAGSAEYVDYAVGEVDVKTFGGTADAKNAGVNINVVVKSGGNEFHGRAESQLIHHRFNSTNVDDRLRAQGVADGDALLRFWEPTVELGGRIVRDRLWFFANYHDQRSVRTVSGYAAAPGPDGKYGTPDDVRGEQPAFLQTSTVKLSYQATTRHKFVGVYLRSRAEEEQAQGNRFIPFESATYLNDDTTPWKGEWQGLFGSRLLANAYVASSGYLACYDLTEFWGDPSTSPSTSGRSRLDRATGYRTGPSFTNGGHICRGPVRKAAIGKLTWLPERSMFGNHEFQFGGDTTWGMQVSQYPSYAGDYQLVYDTIGGRPLTPVQLNIKELPLDGPSKQRYSSAYVSDEWRLHSRLTANLGLRWERQRYYLDEQVKPQGQYGLAPPGTFPQVDLRTWQQFAPRLGAAFDLSGDGKTVLKGSYGLFYEDRQPGFGLSYNPNGSPTTYTYRWSDPDGNNDWTPGEVDLSLTGPHFVSFSGPRATFVDPNLKLPSIQQASASIERKWPLVCRSADSMSIIGTRTESPRSTCSGPTARITSPLPAATQGQTES